MNTSNTLRPNFAIKIWRWQFGCDASHICCRSIHWVILSWTHAVKHPVFLPTTGTVPMQRTATCNVLTLDNTLGEFRYISLVNWEPEITDEWTLGPRQDSFIDYILNDLFKYGNNIGKKSHINWSFNYLWMICNIISLIKIYNLPTWSNPICFSFFY